MMINQPRPVRSNDSEFTQPSRKEIMNVLNPSDAKKANTISNNDARTIY